MKQRHFIAGFAVLSVGLVTPIIASAQGSHPNRLAYTGKVTQLGSGEFTMAPRRGPSSVSVTTTSATMYVLMNRITAGRITNGDRILVEGAVDAFNHTVLARRIVDVPAAGTPDRFDEGFGKGRDTAKRVIGSVTSVSPTLTITDASGIVYTVIDAPHLGVFQPSLGTSSSVRDGSTVEVQGRPGMSIATIVAKRVLIAVDVNPGGRRRAVRRRVG